MRGVWGKEEDEGAGGEGRGVGDGGGSFSHGSHVTLVSTGYSEGVFVPVPGDYYASAPIPVGHGPYA